MCALQSGRPKGYRRHQVNRNIAIAEEDSGFRRQSGTIGLLVGSAQCPRRDSSFAGQLGCITELAKLRHGAAAEPEEDPKSRYEAKPQENQKEQVDIDASILDPIEREDHREREDKCFGTASEPPEITIRSFRLRRRRSTRTGVRIHPAPLAVERRANKRRLRLPAPPCSPRRVCRPAKGQYGPVPLRTQG